MRQHSPNKAALTVITAIKRDFPDSPNITVPKRPTAGLIADMPEYIIFWEEEVKDSPEERAWLNSWLDRICENRDRRK